MTAEIAILNRTGVALAADSAVTISGGGNNQKIYNSANKLFALSKIHPVGIMIFGGANFMGVPWETIIKTYRKNLGITKFDTLDEYGKDFLKFLIADKRFYNENTEINLVNRIFYNKLMEILNDDVNKMVNELSKAGELVNNSEVEKIISKVIDGRIDALKDKGLIIDDNDFILEFTTKHFNTINKILDEVINFKLHDNVVKLYLEYCGRFLQSGEFSNSYTGLVISGYGEEEIFPSLYEYHIEGIFLDKFKYQERTPIYINSFISEKYATAAMRPFAQKEMVYSFINGLEPSLHKAILGIIKKSLQSYDKLLQQNYSLDQNYFENEEEILNQVVSIIKNEIQNIQKKYYTKPVVDVLEILPKEELAEMAEALVNLTSFKRRVSMDAETVGGPIDVCIITKGDGLVWIKRKHYFKPELNYNFLKNYLKGME